jgi:hypothetical protein
MLIGRQPFSGSLTEIINQHLYEKLIPIHAQRGDVPKSLEDNG